MSYTTIFFDITGQANTFHGIPLLAMKKANFVDKLQAVFGLAKIVVNGATYNVAETAKNGAVALGESYRRWEFIAPDGQLDFDQWLGMTFGEGLLALKENLSQKPIVPWDKFATWVGQNTGNLTPSGDVKITLETITSGQYSNEIDVLAFSGISDFSSFISTIYDGSVSAHSNPMSAYAQSDRSFGFLLRFVATDSEGQTTTAQITTIFRE